MGKMDTSIVAYHSSPESDITVFAPLSHFGTRQAAVARAQSSIRAGRTSTLYEARLDLGSILRISDLPLHESRTPLHSWLRLIDHLHYDTMPAVLSDGERATILAAAAPFGRNAHGGIAALVLTLIDHGIDTLAYVNLFEDAGSVSWIVLHPDRVSIIRRSAL